METVNVQVPTELLKVANPEAKDFSVETARLLALGLFREGKVSLGRAAELCHTPLATFMDFVAAHNTPPIRYTLGELEEDRRTLAELGL
jgi:predicted HTH domain antitoxin